MTQNQNQINTTDIEMPTVEEEEQKVQANASIQEQAQTRLEYLNGFELETSTEEDLEIFGIATGFVMNRLVEVVD